jgi:restriction system protein
MSHRGGVLRAIAQAQRAAERQRRAHIRANTTIARQAAQAQQAFERHQAQQARMSLADEREQRRLYIEARMAAVLKDNERLTERIAELDGLLADSLRMQAVFSIEEIKPRAQLPVLDIGPAFVDTPPQPAYVAKPSGLQMLIPGVAKKYQRELAYWADRYEEAVRAHEQRADQWQKQDNAKRADHRRRCEALEAEAKAQREEIDQLANDYAIGVPDAVTNYLSLAISMSQYPDGFTQEAKVAYVPESQQLVVEYELPDYTIIPDVAAYKYVKQRDEVSPTPRPATQRKALYTSVICQLALRILRELFETDTARLVQVIVFNGHVNAIDPATGQPTRPCLVTVRATRGVFAQLDLSRVDPAACLRSLNASVSKSPTELMPVRPVLEFSMVDPRFIEQTDVLSSLDKRPNLMELTPGEFEALISNLFQKMGLETRLTQASRDGGVDCVAFDTRPIFGGKVVIQAKRYKHTVGVSAVRDLFGTVQNEGASKGILVTTSGYGKAAFDFAGGKPLELLSGSNLLALLAEHAGLEARIEAPSDWKDPEPDSAPLVGD